MHSYSFCINGLNGGTYIAYQIKHLLGLKKYDCDYEIVVIDGSHNFCDASETNQGLSIDQTARIVTGFKDPKVRFFMPGHVGDRRQLKNLMITRAEKDFLFFLEANEFIKLDDIVLLDGLIDAYDVVDLPNYVFCQDFKHRIHPGISGFQERVVRNTGDLRFIKDLDCCDSFLEGAVRESRELLRLEAPVFIYNIYNDLRNLKNKLQHIREKNWVHTSLHQIPGWKVVDPIKFCMKNDYFDPISIKAVAAQHLEKVDLSIHPAVMKDHPLFGLSKDEINQTPIFMSLGLGDRLVKALNSRSLKILEVGCGPGAVLAKFLESGYDAWGLDPSMFAVEYARKEGLNMEKAILEEGVFSQNFFDVVYGVDVLEHTKDPNTAFENMAAWLKPAGLLILCAPNAEAAWIKDSKHFLWSPKQHFSIPSEEALRSLAIQNGLEVLSLKAEGDNIWLSAAKRG